MRIHPQNNSFTASRLRQLWWSVAGMMLFAITQVFATGFTEPPVVLYGKVIHFSGGASYQVSSGTLQLTLVNQSNPQNTITLETPLGVIGANGQFSYRLEIPQKYLPSSTDLTRVLAVTANNSDFRFSSIRVDGVAAEPLDSAQSLITTSFATRGTEYRLDLRVSLSQLDSDGDGLPDWWENLYGLNPLYAGDALSDEDGDGWTALVEFQRNTDPTQSNIVPSVATTSLLVPVGGSAGLHLVLQDSDTPEHELVFTFLGGLEQVRLVSTNGVLSENDSFSYADVLAGRVLLNADAGFESESLSLRVEDTTSTNPPVTASILLKGFSPATHNGAKPAMWFDANRPAMQMDTNSLVAEWEDASGNSRAAYQPFTDQTPTLRIDDVPAISFASNDFFYIDDRGLDLSKATALFAFAIDSFSTNEQTIFNSANLRLSVGGDKDPANARSLRLRQSTRTVNGPLINQGQFVQTTFVLGTNHSCMDVLGQKFFPSLSAMNEINEAFMTLGACQEISEMEAGRIFNGSINEAIIYSEVVDAGSLSRHQDYQLSRWASLVVWDHRDQTATVTLTGMSGRRYSLNGGWGNDHLVGNSLADILRGGPGADYLTGGAGSDKFQLFATHGNDIITDFSETQGDVIDLTPIFGDMRGSPDAFVSVRAEIVRSNNIPQVNSILQLNFAGAGTNVNQTVTLLNQRITSTDLRRMIAEGVIQLGGPQYTNSVSLAANETQLLETEVPRTLTLNRTGNHDAALTVDVAFSGTATANADFRLTATNGAPTVRTVTFARGQGSKTINLTPIQDIFAESETILVSVLPRADISQGVPMQLTLNDAPQMSIRVINSIATRVGPTPATIEISRNGGTNQAVTVALTFGGSATPGVDYQTPSSTITLPAGVQTQQIQITPTSSGSQGPELVQVSIVPDATRFALGNPWNASALILDYLAGQTQTYGQWLPASGGVDITKDTDADGILDFLEYIHGAGLAQSNLNGNFSVANTNGFLQVTAITAAGLMDVDFELESTRLAGSSNFYPVIITNGTSFSLTLQSTSDGRVKRKYSSTAPVASLGTNELFRLKSMLIAAPDVAAEFAEAFGTAEQDFVAHSGPAWVPSFDGTTISAPALANGQSSEFSTFVSGPFTVSFQWQTAMDPTDELVLYVDDVQVATASGSMGWSNVSHTTATPGDHQLRWVIRRGSGVNAAAAWMRALQLSSL
jgi:hypothetical protein